MNLSRLLFLNLCGIPIAVNAFVVGPKPASSHKLLQQSKQSNDKKFIIITSLNDAKVDIDKGSVQANPSEDQEEVVQCFIVNEDLVQSEGDDPEVVCTSEPDEYAWFNGIERNKMKPTDGELEGKMECVEGSSPKGTPEWECK